MRRTCLNCVHRLAEQDARVVFIGSDLGQGTLDEYKEQLPDRFFMEGVSEANVIGMAAGLALSGKIPYVNTIASFLTRRCFEQVAIDLCLHRLNVRLIGNGGGLVYAPLGPTHLAPEDIAIMRALPNMTVVAPCDAEEMTRLMPETLEYPGPIYIRLAKGGDPVVSDPARGFSIGRAISCREGGDALIVTTGILLKPGLDAAAALAADGVDVGVLHAHTVKPLDTEAVLERAAAASVVITAEEHSVIGGLGSAVAELLLEAGVPLRRFRRVGIPDCFPDQYGSQASLLARYDVTTDRLCNEIRAGL